MIIDHLNAETMTVMMVESRRAIDNLREILKVPGLDCIMIGPDDLAGSRRSRRDAGASPPGSVRRDLRLVQQARVPYGLSAQSPEMAQEWVEKGATWIPYQNDAAMVLNAARAAVPQLMQIGGRA